MAIQELDEARAEAFAGRMPDALNAPSVTLMRSVGYPTGLFEGVAELAPSTSVDATPIDTTLPAVPGLQAPGDAGRDYRCFTERLLTLADHLLYPGHSSGSVCGRGLEDIRPAPPQQAEMVAPNRGAAVSTRA